MYSGENVGSESAGLTDWDKIKEESSFNNEKLDIDVEIDKKCKEAIEMKKAPEGLLRQDFPSGVYLFHSARIEQIDEIFESGQILNAGAIMDQKTINERKRLLDEGKTSEEIEQELKKVSINYNSGQEGISWSVNGIDAMPGTDGHIAGFLAAPEDILGNDKLVLPSSPAPYELLQVSEKMDAEKFYEVKKQFDVWGYKTVSPFEKASVESGILALKFVAEDRRKGDTKSYFSSFLESFKNRGGLAAEELRKYYKYSKDGHLEIDEELSQQKFDEKYLPPAAVFIQALIDRGDFRDTLAEGKNVNEIIEMCFESNDWSIFLLGKERQESKWYADTYEAEIDRVGNVSADIQNMYFVTCRRDLDGWARKMKETGYVPKGILLYDENEVVKENFARFKSEDNLKLEQEINHAVGVDKDFWHMRMDIDVEKKERSGYMSHVLKESEINHQTEVKLIDGELQVFKH